MKIQTFSIVAGSEACNARCPFCISKMTPKEGVTLKETEVNWRNFRKAARLAEKSGCTTAMITGKGEPTLFPDQVTKYLEELEGFDFPLIEIQSNGIPTADRKPVTLGHLRKWYEHGLNTVAISIVHYKPERNHEVYLPYRQSYIDLPELIRYLHNEKFSVRLACVMANGFIDSPEEVQKLIDFAKENKVEQLTARPVNKPEDSRDTVAYKWAQDHHLRDYQKDSVTKYIGERGHKLMELPHGATVYDIGGQNFCLANSLTLPKDEEIRQLIFFPDGHLRFDWQYEGAILI